MAARLYQVGGSAGWTSMGDVDYQDWAANKKFHVGDTLVFHHNYRFHDVKQVTRQDFKSCNVASPIASYYNHHGYDSLTLNRLGHSTSYLLSLITAKLDKRLISWSHQKLQVRLLRL